MNELEADAIRKAINNLGSKQGSISKGISAYKGLTEKVTQDLVTSYKQNIEIVVDVSELLNSYNTFIKEIIGKLNEINQTLTDPIRLDDFEALRSATAKKIAELKNHSAEKIDRLKKIDPIIASKFEQQVQNMQVLENNVAMYDPTNQSQPRAGGGAKNKKVTKKAKHTSKK